MVEVADSRPYTEEEAATVEALATETLSKNRIATGDSIPSAREIPGQVKPMTYHVPPSDVGSWVLVWELALDANGQVFGTPTKAPRNQLGLWLEYKKRADGGPRFSVQQPARVRAEAQYPCLHQECTKRMYTRQDMVEHVQATHPRDARLYKDLLDGIMKQVAKDNPRIAEIVATYSNLQESGLLSVPADQQVAAHDADTTMGLPQVTTMGIKREDGCASCDWKYKPEWSEAQRHAFLTAHIRFSHKEEL